MRRGLLAAVVLLLLVPTATVAAQPRTAPTAMQDRLLAAPQPNRDPIDLAVRLRGLPPEVAYATPAPSGPLTLGQEDTFWILDQRSAQLFQTTATLRLITEHVYWYVETALADRAPQADLERSAAVFETRTYPLIHQFFGSEPSPGVDGDPRIVMLLGNVPGVAAYFSSADAYSREVNPRSNEHEMIYINVNSLRPGQPGFDSTLTHEFQHMAHFARCPGQESWIDEGAAELSIRVAGYETGPPQAFLAQPSIQLNAWSSRPQELARHYQAAYLFLRYTAERAGGWDALPRLFASCARGEAQFNSFVQLESLAPDIDAFFSDWAVANLLQDPNVADGRYAYANPAFRVTASVGPPSADAALSGSLPQYAADYVELPAGPGTASFSGDPSIALVQAAEDGQPLWWSNRGDSMNSRLIRQVDLTAVSEAALRFRAWYDLESEFDFVYLTASTDGGATWQVLSGRHTVPDQATGNSYGVGWTGSSGAAWVDEEVDLTPFAGSVVWLRFDYVTDQSYNAQGFGLRDVEIPQVGVSEPGAPENAWTPEGWVLVDAPVPQRWNLRLVRWTPSGVHVDPVEVAADGSASVALDESASRTVLVVAPTAPRTLLPAKYQVAVAD